MTAQHLTSRGRHEPNLELLDYMNVDLEILWEVVHRNVPELADALAKIVPSE